MSDKNFPAITRKPNINVADFARQNFTYAFHVHIPTGAQAATMSRFVDGPFSSTPDTNIIKDKILTCTIPYVQSVQVTRPASVQVIPTLGGGKHVEDRGRTRQQISLTGTSGHLSAVKPITDPFNPQSWSQDLRNVSERMSEIWGDNTAKLNRLGKRSGYAWFHRLSRLFEIYWEIKRIEKPEIARQVKMIWINERDKEFLIVVPMAFNFQRSAPKNAFTYDFSISMEVIENFGEDLSKQISDANAAVIKKNLLQRFNDNIRRVSQTITAARDYANLLVDKSVNQLLRGEILAVVHNGLDVLVNSTDALLNISETLVGSGSAVLSDVIGAIDKVRVGIRNVIELTQFWSAPGGGLMRAVNEWAVGVENAANQLAATTQGNTNDAIYSQRFASFDEFYNSTRPTEALVGTRKSNLTSGWSATGPTYNKDVTSGAIGKNAITSGNPLYDNNILSPGLAIYEETRNETRSTWTGVKSVRVREGDTIFDIARRELGDINFWIDLVVLNNLKPPYTLVAGSSSSPGELKADDEIMIPGPYTNTFEDLKVLISSSLRSLPQEFGQATGPGILPPVPTLNKLKLTDVTKNTSELRWYVDQWKGFNCVILTGTNAGESRLIKSNDGFNLYFYGTSTNPTSSYSEWPLPIDPSSQYQIVLQDAGSTIGGVLPFQNFDRVLGMDLEARLNNNNKLDLVLAPNGDAAVIEGLPAAAQSILLLIHTPIGANPFLPRDGIPAKVGEKLTPEVTAEYWTFLRAALTSDPRVTGIQRETLIVNEFSDIIGFEATVQFVDGSITPVGMTS